MAKKPIEDPNNLMHYLLVTHAPLIQKNIKSLRAKGHLPSQEDMEDWEFHEAGMRGLMEAVTKYDPKLGSFPTYANASIRGRIQNHADSLHQIPKHIRMQAKRYEELHREPAPSRSPAQPAPKAEPKSPAIGTPDPLKGSVPDDKA